ncbi:MAG: TraB/GumN family protein [Rubrivivax sp.]
MNTLAHWKRRLAAVLLVIGVLPPALAQDCPPPIDPTPAPVADRGPLWTIERDGHRSWLYGTLHLGKPGWTIPGPRIAQALADADVVALELDPEDPAVQRVLVTEALRPVPPLPPALAERLQRAERAACVDNPGLAALHPAMRAIVVTLAEARRARLDTAWGQEPALATAARAGSRKLVALETAESQATLLMPREAGAIAAAVERSLQPLESDGGVESLRRLAAAWERADLATLEDYEQWCDCVADDADREALHELVDARNPALADAIEAQHAAGGRVFAAVGAMHMVGDQGLPKLLAARGFVVRAVTPAR